MSDQVKIVAAEDAPNNTESGEVETSAPSTPEAETATVETTSENAPVAEATEEVVAAENVAEENAAAENVAEEAVAESPVAEVAESSEATSATVATSATDEAIEAVAESVPATLDRIMRGQARQITLERPDLPPALDVFFARAFVHDPTHRFQSASELAVHFERACQGVSLEPPGRLSKTKSLATCSRGRW